jgi:CRISPR-associated protein Csb3
LDWWGESPGGSKELKTWAGRMSGFRIARAMQAELGRSEFDNGGLFGHGLVVYDPLERDKKVEPFYFDARRGSSAHPLDVGFAPDPLQMTSTAYPAVEFLCLVGLQRFRPAATPRPRVFEYHLWSVPLAPSIAAVAACGLLPQLTKRVFRFENAFRTDQRKHKGFASATPI